LLGNYSFIDFWSYHLRASSLASEVHGLLYGLPAGTAVLELSGTVASEHCCTAAWAPGSVPVGTAAGAPAGNFDSAPITNNDYHFSVYSYCTPVRLKYLLAILPRNLLALLPGNALALLPRCCLALLPRECLAVLSRHLLAHLVGDVPALLPGNRAALLPLDGLAILLGNLVALLAGNLDAFLPRHLGKQ
jgi:hypothetical protein